MASLYVVDLTYVADMKEVEGQLDAHREFLARYYEQGMFLASGRKEPRTGGVILATGTRGDVEGAVAEDPFHVAGLADYEITEFLPTKTGPALESFREPV